MQSPDSNSLTDILDSLPLAVTTVRPDGIILFVNATAARNLSKSREEIIGTLLFDYFPDRELATRERLRQTVTRGTVQHFESVVMLPDGSKRFFDSAYCPTRGPDGEVNAIQIVSQDVTTLRESQHASASEQGLWGVVTDDLSMTKERVEALLENAPIIVSVYDLDTTIRYMNRVLPGMALEDVIGKSPLDRILEESRAVFQRAFARVLETRQVTECTVEGRSGGSWLVRLAPLIHDGEVRQVLGCTLDVTEQKRLQAQLAHERKVESLGTMASGIAHDFNNLLTAILGNASLARQQLALGGDAGGSLQGVENAARRASEICDQMLVYAGRDRRGSEPGQLNAVITEMSRLTRAAVSNKIEMVYELADELPASTCDRAKLGQVVLNLINNAADAVGGEDGRITVQTSLVEVDRQLEGYLPASPPKGRYVRLRVSDNGPGLAPEAAQRIFDPFYSTKVAGHGLGLSVVFGIVSANEAAISVHSERGVGTTMTVLFSVSELAPADVSTRESEPAPPGVGGAVLVVDDEKAVREVAAMVLRRAGYRVLEAENGDAALAVLAEHGAQLDAMLLDVTMPGRDGYSTLQELRKLHPELPVVLSSGAPLRPEISDPHVRVLPKPFTPARLTAAITEAVQSRRSVESSPAAS